MVPGNAQEVAVQKTLLMSELLASCQVSFLGPIGNKPVAREQASHLALNEQRRLLVVKQWLLAHVRDAQVNERGGLFLGRLQVNVDLFAVADLKCDLLLLEGSHEPLRPAHAEFHLI